GRSRQQRPRRREYLAGSRQPGGRLPQRSVQRPAAIALLSRARVQRRLGGYRLRGLYADRRLHRLSDRYRRVRARGAEPDRRIPPDVRQRHRADVRQQPLLRRARPDLHRELARRVLMRLLALLHRWVGGIVGLLLAVIGLSGTLLVWEEYWIGLAGADDPLRGDLAAMGGV